MRYLLVFNEGAYKGGYASFNMEPSYKSSYIQEINLHEIETTNGSW